MLQDSYNVLDGAMKLGLTGVADNAVLHNLIEAEISDVREQLCNLTPGQGLDLPYAIMQQRLISLKDLKAFFKQVREDLTPQQNTE